MVKKNYHLWSNEIPKKFSKLATTASLEALFYSEQPKKLNLMDKLGGFLKTLTQVEKNSFRNYLKSKARGKDNQRILLFDLMTREKAPADLKKALYKKQNYSENGFYQLRKSLVHDLEAYFFSHLHSLDHKREIYRKIELAQHFIDRLQYELSWNYLKEAEDIAVRNGFFEILFAIYTLQLRLCECEPGYKQSTSEIINKKRRHLEVMQELNDVFLGEQINLEGSDQIEDVVLKISRDLQLSYDNYNGGLITRKISRLTQVDDLPSGVLHDFRRIMEQVLDSRQDEFSPYSLVFQYNLMVFLCLKTRDIAKAGDYMLELERLIKTNENIPLHVLLDSCCLKAELLIYSGNLPEAREKMERAWQRYHQHISPDYAIKLISILINISFISRKFEEGLQYFELLESHKESFVQLYGQHSYYKILLVKALMQLELEDDNGIHKTIHQVEKSISLLYFKKALQLLKYYSSESSKAGQETFQSCPELIHFVHEYPFHGFVLKTPDFRLWTQALYEHSDCHQVAVQPKTIAISKDEPVYYDPDTEG